MPFLPRYLSLGRISTQTTNQLIKRTKGFWDNRAQKLGGWSLDAHHVYDAESRTLYRGDGTKVVGRALQTRLKVFAGTGEAGFAGDGGPAIGAVLDEPSSPAMAPDGSIYFADVGNQRIRVVEPDGTIQTVVGTGETCTAEGGGGLGEEVPTGGLPCTDDGLLGLETGIDQPERLTFGPDGRLYFVDTAQHCVRRNGPRTGIVRRVAGVCQWVDGNPGGGSLTGEAERGTGDGGPARFATVYGADIAVRRDDTLLVVDGGLRDVTPDGIIETLLEDAGFTAIAVGANEEIYLASAGQGKVFRLRPNGPLEEFAAAATARTAARATASPRSAPTFAASSTIFISAAMAASTSKPETASCASRPTAPSPPYSGPSCPNRRPPAMGAAASGALSARWQASPSTTPARSLPQTPRAKPCGRPRSTRPISSRTSSCSPIARAARSTSLTTKAATCAPATA